MLQFIDIGTSLIALVLSAALVIRFGPLGFIAGVFAFWAFTALRIEALYRMDPTRDSSILDAAWVFTPAGWLAGAAWCSPFLLGRWLLRRRAQRMKQGVAGAITNA